MLLAPPAHVVTLPAGNVDGHAVLGASIARIEAELGRPVRVERFPVRRVQIWPNP